MKPWQVAGWLVVCLIGQADAQSGSVPREHQLDAIAVTLAPPVAALPRPEKLESFDAGAVRLERRDDRWVILSGDTVLKDCGTRDEEAHRVWRLIGQLGLTQRGVIGAKQPIMEYWLANGQALQGLPRGLRVMPINLAELKLEKAQGFWVLRESTRVLFNFGTEEQEAKQALAIMRKYGFNCVGIVGQAVPAMLLFVAHPESAGARTSTARKEPGQGRQESVAQTSAKQPAPSGTLKPTPSTNPYPTPIVPPLLDRGRPSRTAAGPNTDALPEVAALGASSDRVTFDYRQAQVRRENADWVLAVGKQTIARFGTSERYARQAHAAMLNYRLTEMHRIGPEATGVCYFLSSGQAPRGLMIGVIGENFQPERLTIRQYGERHFLVQGSRPFLDAGGTAEEAQQLLAAIRQHRFDHVCRIGQTDKECLMLLVRSY